MKSRWSKFEGISIHALREEGDHSGRNACESGEYISIHALREEGDVFVNRSFACMYDFYPRPPRGGRHMDDVVVIAPNKISIHALREEGDLDAQHDHERRVISIHALREEGDSG